MIVRHLNKAVAVNEAAKSYLRRTNGVELPVGKIKYGWKWYPLKKEKCNLCGGVLTPSIAWPNTFWDHCLSPEHVARKYGVTTVELLQEVEAMKNAG